VDVPFTLRIPSAPAAARPASRSSDAEGSIVVPGLEMKVGDARRIEYRSSCESSMKACLVIEVLAKHEASDPRQRSLLGDAKAMCASEAYKGFRADAISRNGQPQRLGGGLVTFRESVERGGVHLELVAAWFADAEVAAHVVKQLLAEAAEVGFDGLGVAPSRVVLPEMTPTEWRALVEGLPGAFLL
jgi:hypothetical protein